MGYIFNIVDVDYRLAPVCHDIGGWEIICELMGLSQNNMTSSKDAINVSQILTVIHNHNHLSNLSNFSFLDVMTYFFIRLSTSLRLWFYLLCHINPYM